MENPNNQEQAPVSIIEQQKKEAGSFVTSRINSLIQENNLSNLEAARVVYKEVKGNDYRKEQASAKLLEYLNMANEIDMREKEIVSTYPSMNTIINIKPASNDDKFLIAA
ncbi:hypothetical protein K9M47_01425 [Candidatus Gracilibacteria bacterium]|nr:hypothetical protein [Candidatus Gracilibacteria bacterium]